MTFDSTTARVVCRHRQAVLLPGVCVVACTLAACGVARPFSKDFSAYCAAMQIKVQIDGVRPITVVTDPERIKVACEFIKPYGQGWKSPRWQGAAPSRRRFDFWDGDRYIGEFGINPDTITTDNYYQDAPAEEIAKLAAVFELKWPAQ